MLLVSFAIKIAASKLPKTDFFAAWIWFKHITTEFWYQKYLIHSLQTTTFPCDRSYIPAKQVKGNKNKES